MESVELYTIDCPKCHVLESKLNSKNIVYNIIKGDDAKKEIKAHGFLSAPILRVNDEFLEFSKAIEWVNNRG